MKSIRSFSFFTVLMLLAGIVGIAPKAAHAQVAEGKFSLPSETHWGSMILPAGEYTFSLESTGRPAWLTIRNSDRVLLGMITPQVLSSAPYTDKSELVLTHKGDEVFVSSLRVGELAIAFNYAMPETETASPDHSVSLGLKKVFHLH